MSAIHPKRTFALKAEMALSVTNLSLVAARAE
jgi:hypothetical protein